MRHLFPQFAAYTMKSEGPDPNLRNRESTAIVLSAQTWHLVSVAPKSLQPRLQGKHIFSSLIEQRLEISLALQNKRGVPRLATLL